MRTQRLNVLVYSGSGSTVGSVGHCLYSLRRLLSPNYAVHPITADTILKEPWRPSCALLVFPGGGDLGYCRSLNGEGNTLIRQYVNAGGAYLGLCAGGYYGSGRCEWEVGSGKMEVVGDRELAFFPGVCRGSVFSGFVYNSEAGAYAARMRLAKGPFASSGGALPETFRLYCNGGGTFVDAEDYAKNGIEVLASYTENLHVDPGKGSAAVVFRQVGEGKVILTGTHPEFAAINLSKDTPGMNPDVVDALVKDDKQRSDFLKACLRKLGLQVSDQEQDIPPLSRLHLSSPNKKQVRAARSAIIAKTNEVAREIYLEAETDTFHVEEPSSTWSMSDLTRAILESQQKATSSEPKPVDSPLVDYEQVIKRLSIHDEAPPSAQETPYFDHEAYFAHLLAYTPVRSSLSLNSECTIGAPLLYGEVVTSTSTLLEKNQKLTSNFRTGTTFTATTQLSARGRGSNAWLSPPGALMFSTVLHHPLTINVTAPVVFVQYLAAIAVAEAVQTYDLSGSAATIGAKSAYRALPVKLKWPNDVYILDPSRAADGISLEDGKAYSKIGGILVNSSYTEGSFTLVVGVGLNVSNAAPTTSLNAVLSHINKTQGKNLEHFTLERLLAKILATFSRLYTMFCARGFQGDVEQLYYKHWLHGEQIVTLETENGALARIKGITTDWGLLVAEEVRETGRDNEVISTGKKFALQSDSNSFDFFKGLLKRKI